MFELTLDSRDTHSKTHFVRSENLKLLIEWLFEDFPTKK